MIYDYLLTAFKVIVGLITTERLIYGAAIALGAYLIWIAFSLALSFQKKFNKNCVKLYNFVKKSQLTAKDVNSVDVKASMISSGFSHGWKKFKSSATGRPSDFINRRDALDVEVNGGVLNQGKSFMRSFINIATFILFLLNFAYLGNTRAISCYVIAEAMVLPLVFYVISKIFYFMYTSIKQQLYKSDIESLYDLLDLLDQIFAKNAGMVAVPFETAELIQGEDEIATTEGEQLISEEVETEKESEETSAETQEEKQEDVYNPLDKYDFFKKKKNIDVDKLMNEVPSKSSSAPYINVDSGYVIKDDEDVAVSKTITSLENGGSLLGGMMQDMSSIKKNQKENEEKEEQKEEQKEEISVELAQEETKEEISEDPFEGLGKFEVAENAKVEEVAQEPIKEPESEEVKLEIPDVEPIETKVAEPEPEPVHEEPELSEEQRETIATVVGSFKPKSKLASGGVVIERNEPISRRESSNYSIKEETEYDEVDDGEDFDNYQNNGITQLSAESDADGILNSFRASAGGYEEYPTYNNMQSGMYNQGYGAPQYNQGYGYQPQGYPAQNFGMQQPYQPMTPGYDPYAGNGYADSYTEEVEQYQAEQEEDKKLAKKTAVKRSKEDEPRPRNLKKKESKPVMTEEVKTTPSRGRPKKQVFDDKISIKNDKEFDEVLARAEKLMRKSEEGLSASQSKRIEKELKMLMDAMNKYKEGV